MARENQRNSILRESNRISISVLDIILEEASPELLEEGASVKSSSIAVIQNKLLGCHCGEKRSIQRSKIDIFLICHVTDDVGQAVVRGALEHAGIIGKRDNQVRVTCRHDFPHAL